MKNENQKQKASEYKLAESISIVSHQLKSPLSTIKGYIEVLISEDIGKINDSQREYLNNILEAAIRLIGLIQDFLNVSEIEEGKLQIKPIPARIDKIIEDSINEFSTLGRAKNCVIKFSAPDDLPILNIDAVKIKQVIDNLITNAISYKNKKGEIKITLEKKADKVVFCCEDNGIGIPEDKKNNIFTKFYRSEEAFSLVPSGSGVGLFISKAIINKSGGEIWFDSKVGEGSKFYFSLPIKNL